MRILCLKRFTKRREEKRIRIILMEISRDFLSKSAIKEFHLEARDYGLFYDAQ